MTQEEVAAYLGVSARYLRGLRLEGGGPPVHYLNGSAKLPRYLRSEVDEWATRHGAA